MPSCAGTRGGTFSAELQWRRTAVFSDNCMLPSRAHSALQRLARFTSTMASPQKIIFHDLISTHEGPHPAAIGPNTWKARLALYHKGVDFELKYLTFSELRALAPKLGVERPRSTSPIRSPRCPACPANR